VSGHCCDEQSQQVCLVCILAYYALYACCCIPTSLAGRAGSSAVTGVSLVCAYLHKYSLTQCKQLYTTHDVPYLVALLTQSIKLTDGVYSKGIAALQSGKQHKAALQLYSEMHVQGVRPTARTLHFALRSAAAVRDTLQRAHTILQCTVSSCVAHAVSDTGFSLVLWSTRLLH
jgi:pentatricopeptide repeat protein